jgi:butyrate kinase
MDKSSADGGSREESMGLTDEQRQFYENTMKVTKQEIADLDTSIEQVLAQVKDRLAELQSEKKATLQMYDAACRRLGVPNDLAGAEGDDESAG